MSNRPRREIVRSMLATVLLGMTLGCGENSPAGPTSTPVTPAPAAPAVYTVTASTNTVAPGGQLSVSWTASIGGHRDAISLFKKGDPNTAHGWWEDTDGALSGTSTLSAPSQAGQYEFRYLRNGLEDVARSSVVTVG